MCSCLHMLNHLKEQLGLAKDGNSNRIDRHVTVRLAFIDFSNFDNDRSVRSN